MHETDNVGNPINTEAEQQEAILAMLNALTVATLRNYDATMALLSTADAALCDEVESTHARGELMGPEPFMSENPWPDNKE